MRPLGLSTRHIAAVRTVLGAPIVAEAGPYLDAAFSPVPDPLLGGAFDADGFATVWLGVEIASGTNNATATIALLVRDDGAPDGHRWKGLLVNGAATEVTPPADGFIEVRVDGRLVFPVIRSVTGLPTRILVLAFPGARLAGRSVDS